MADKIVLILIACPVFIIPIMAGLALAFGIWAFIGVMIDRMRGPKVIYTPKKDSPELIEAIQIGYSPRLGMELSEIFPDQITRTDIDRLIDLREKLFPIEFSEFFYSGQSPDLSPTEFKTMALRLYLEMAFTRSYLLENTSGLWTDKIENLWIFHTPKPLRKLAPDYYRQLLVEFKNTKRAKNRSPVAA